MKNPECQKWLKDCLKVFPIVSKKRIKLSCEYKTMHNRLLGRIRTKIYVNRNIDPEALLLLGISKAKISRRFEKNLFIEINNTLKKIDHHQLREQVVKNIIVHELLHIERGDLLDLSKSYSHRKRKKVHSGLDQEAFKRYNHLRELEGMKKIKREEDLHSAVSKLFEKIK